MSDDALAAQVAPRMGKRGVAAQAPGSPDLAAACGLFKDRAGTLEELADLVSMLWLEPAQTNLSLAQELAAQIKPEARPALQTLAQRLELCQWDKVSIAAVFKEVLAAHGLKMPQLAVPVRLTVFGRSQTPSVDAMLALMSRDVVLRRLRQ